jgi:hypothetical protein
MLFYRLNPYILKYYLLEMLLVHIAILVYLIVKLSLSILDFYYLVPGHMFPMYNNLLLF